MEDKFLCCICSFKFDSIDYIPLVLKCGDSACMNCLIKLSSLSQGECMICNYRFPISFSLMKDLPVNKAVLLLINQNPKISRFEVGELDEVSPYLEHKELCKRRGCQNPKYEHMNVIYQYCGVKCMEEEMNDLKGLEDLKQFS